MKEKAFKKALWQVPVLILLAIAVSVATNQWRRDGLPLIGDWSVESRFIDASGESLVISLEGSMRLFESDEAIFVDARPESQYVKGHIHGAINLPWQDLDRYFMEVVERLDVSKAIITYCDGVACDLGHELALFLNEVGFEKVYVLVNGWSLWLEAGLPVEKGSGNDG